jgi:hypothetical protein
MFWTFWMLCPFLCMYVQYLTYMYPVLKSSPKLFWCMCLLYSNLSISHYSAVLYIFCSRSCILTFWHCFFNICFVVSVSTAVPQLTCHLPCYVIVRLVFLNIIVTFTIFSIFYALIRCINLIKQQHMQFGFMNVILLRSDYWHVSATNMIVFIVKLTTSSLVTITSIFECFGLLNL